MSFFEMSERQLRNIIDTLSDNQLRSLLLVKAIGGENDNLDSLTISENLLRDYADRFDFSLIDITDNISEKFIDDFADELDFTRYQRTYTSKELFEKIKDRIDLDTYLISTSLSDEFIEEQFDTLKTNNTFFAYQNISTDFVENHMDEISNTSFKTLFYNSSFEYDDAFLDRHIADVDWSAVTQKFAEENKLNIDTVLKYQDYLDWKIVSDNSEKLTEDITTEFEAMLSYGKENYNRDQLLAIKQAVDYNSAHEIKIDIDNFIENIKSAGPMADYQELINLEIENLESDSRASEQRKTEEADKSKPTFTDEQVQNDKISPEDLDKANLTEEQIKIASETQSLSAPFMTKFRNFLDWTAASINQKFTERFANMHEDLIDWDNMSKQPISLSFYTKHQDQLNLQDVLLNNEYSARKLNKIDWENNSEKFTDYRVLEKYQGYISLDKVDWSKVDIANKMYPDFFLSNVEELNIDTLSTLPNLTLPIVDRLSESQYFVDRFDYTQYFETHDVDINYLDKYQDEIDWDEISKSPKLTPEIADAFSDNINWTLAINNPALESVKEQYALTYAEQINFIQTQKEAFENSDLSVYTEEQLAKIRNDFSEGIDATAYANPKFTVEQMEQIGLAVASKYDVTTLANPDFSVEQMKSLIYAYTRGVDISEFSPSFSIERMKEERERALAKTDPNRVYKTIERLDNDLNSDGKYASLYDEGYSLNQIRALAYIDSAGINIDFAGDPKRFTGVQLNLIASSLKFNETKEKYPAEQIDMDVLINSNFTPLEMEIYARGMEQRAASGFSHHNIPYYFLEAQELKDMSHNKQVALLNAIKNKVNIEPFITEDSSAKHINNVIKMNLERQEKFNNFKTRVVDAVKSIVVPIVNTLKAINNEVLNFGEEEITPEQEPVEYKSAKKEEVQPEKSDENKQEELAEDKDEDAKATSQEEEPFADNDNVDPNVNEQEEELSETTTETYEEPVVEDTTPTPMEEVQETIEPEVEEVDVPVQTEAELTNDDLQDIASVVNASAQKAARNTSENTKSIGNRQQVLSDANKAVNLISSTIISNEEFGRMYDEGTLENKLQTDIKNIDEALNIINSNKQLKATTDIETLLALKDEKIRQVNMFKNLEKAEVIETAQEPIVNELSDDDILDEVAISLNPEIEAMGVTDVIMRKNEFSVIINGSDEIVINDKGDIVKNELMEEVDGLESSLDKFLKQDKFNDIDGNTVRNNVIKPVITVDDIAKKISEITGMENISTNLSKKSNKFFVNGEKDGNKVYVSITMDGKNVYCENNEHKFYDSLTDEQRRKVRQVLKTNFDSIKSYEQELETNKETPKKDLNAEKQTEVKATVEKEPEVKVEPKQLDSKTLSKISNIVNKSDVLVAEGYRELLQKVSERSGIEKDNSIYGLSDVSTKMTNDGLLSINGNKDGKNYEINFDLQPLKLAEVKVDNSIINLNDKSISKVVDQSNDMINLLKIQKQKVGMTQAFVAEKNILSKLAQNVDSLDIDKVNIKLLASTEQINRDNKIVNTLGAGYVAITGKFDKNNPDKEQQIGISKDGEFVKSTMDLSDDLKSELSNMVKDSNMFAGYTAAFESGMFSMFTQAEVEKKLEMDKQQHPEAFMPKTEKINEETTVEQESFDYNYEPAPEVVDDVHALVKDAYIDTVNEWMEKARLSVSSIINDCINEYQTENGLKEDDLPSINEMYRRFDEKMNDEQSELHFRLPMDNGQTLDFVGNVNVVTTDNGAYTVIPECSVQLSIPGVSNKLSLFSESVTIETGNGETIVDTMGSLDNVYKAYEMGQEMDQTFDRSDIELALDQSAR